MTFISDEKDFRMTTTEVYELDNELVKAETLSTFIIDNYHLFSDEACYAALRLHEKINEINNLLIEELTNFIFL